MMTYGRLRRFISFLCHHSDVMPCDDPDDEINQFQLPDPKLWAKRGRVNSNQTGKKKKKQTKIKWTKEGVNGMENYIMDTDY